MGQTKKLYCLECEEDIWIGQSNYIYDNEETFSEIKDFLLKHEGHKIICANDEFIYAIQTGEVDMKD